VGKLVLILGGPGSGKSKMLRDMFMDHVGTARFLECRHKPDNISHIFANHSNDKTVAYLDNLEDVPAQVAGCEGSVFIDAPQFSVMQVLAMVTLASAYKVDVYAPLRLTAAGTHPFLQHRDAVSSVEYRVVE